MSDYPVPGFDGARAEKMAAATMRGPLKDGLLVLFMAHCPHCERSLMSNGYPTATSNGTQVGALDLEQDSGQDYFRRLPNVGLVQKDGHNFYSVAGTAIVTVPAVLRVVNGQVQSVLTQGEFGAGDLDKMAAHLQVQKSALSKETCAGSAYQLKPGEALNLNAPVTPCAPAASQPPGVIRY